MPPPIFDSHVHFWDLNRLRYPWLDTHPQLKRTFLPADLLAQAEGLELSGLVFVQADCVPDQALAEARWVTELAEAEPRIQAIVAHAPLEQGHAVRPALAQLAALPLVRGVRRLIQGEAAGFATQPAFVAGVQLLAEFGFSFDICVRHQQLDEVLLLVDQCPEVRFVLDHCGKPNVKDHVMHPWQEQVTRLAAFPNVHCKLSGLLTEADHTHWTPADLRPYLEHVIDVFGVSRVMVGSDWPVARLAGTYQRWIDVVDQATAQLGLAAQRQLFAANAGRVYRCLS